VVKDERKFNEVKNTGRLAKGGIRHSARLEDHAKFVGFTSCVPLKDADGKLLARQQKIESGSKLRHPADRKPIGNFAARR
jgi:hypothetical protein